ncbi:MAG TPA: reverse transcriptase family protein [Kofleriaceae bacterium]|nr:reverse transcriptase family protein [Kofleriaceae bacterium]
MGFWDKLKRVFGGRPRAGEVAPGADDNPPRREAREAAPSRPRADQYRNDEILGLSAADFRKRALRINPYRTAWIGRTDTIPPQSDERTALIDRGLILRGLLTEAQIAEIHRIGDAWLAHRDAVRLAEAAAHATADAAIVAERERKQALREAKRRLAAEREAARVAAVAHRKATDIIYAGRGVSARLGDRRSNVEALQQHGVPVLATPSDVAGALGLTVPQLRWLCFHTEAAQKTHYVYFAVPKRSGGTRLLAAPHAKLAAAQQWIQEHILGKLELTPYAHGFVPQRSTVTNARLHVGRSIVINLDLADFFPSITYPRVRGLFESIGYSPAAATLLALLVTEAPRVKVVHDGTVYWVAAGDRALPQGACTSPTISNLVARKLDRRLAGAVAKLGWTYSRYADDLTFSAGGDAKPRMSLVMSRVRAIVIDEGFRVNEAKGRVQRAAARQQVTGIVVNDKLGVPREELRRLRAILHGAKTTGLAAQNREGRRDFEAYLRGKIAYVSMIDPGKGRALLASLDAVT